MTISQLHGVSIAYGIAFRALLRGWTTRVITFDQTPTHKTLQFLIQMEQEYHDSVIDKALIDCIIKHKWIKTNNGKWLSYSIIVDVDNREHFSLNDVSINSHIERVGCVH